jgi:hypothetical protein
MRDLAILIGVSMAVAILFAVLVIAFTTAWMLHLMG